jgi:hypothetical protein
MKNQILEGNEILHDDQPIGPLEKARENLEHFADNLITQDSLRKMVEWMFVLRDILVDPDVNEFEKQQTIQELKMMEEAWSLMADTFREKGISA